MPSPRQPRPRRRPLPPELIEVFRRMAIVGAFKDACHKQAWDVAHANGSRRCGCEEFAAAEAVVVASGHARPPEEWFIRPKILDDWYAGRL